MKRWTALGGMLLLLLMLASCASQPPAPAPLEAASPGSSGQRPDGPVAAAQAPATGGHLDSEDAILADLANEPPPQVIADPLEPMNRGIFLFNDALYRHVLDPASRGYKTVTPEGMRLAVKNLFTNLLFPLRAVSAVLQGKFERAGQEIARFVINTSLGVGGMGDAAKDLFDLPAPPEEDLGQVMATWGVGHGFYLILPVLGPSSLRDGVGFFGGAYLDPVWYLPVGFWEAAGIKSVDWFNRYSFVEGEYADLTAGAVDPYVALRDFYLQHRIRVWEE